MPLGFLLKAVQGVDYDSDELYKSPEHAAFIKNMCLDLNDNSSAIDGTVGAEGDNSGVFTPIESNEVLCPMPLPSGANYVIGFHESQETNEAYVFVFNSLRNHLIYVIDGYTSRCQVVRMSSCLNFKLVPGHYIAAGRCVLQTYCYYNKATSAVENKKYLIFTDNQPPIKFISVTDSIATNGFSLPFFKNDNCTECDMLALAVPTPTSCIGIKEVARDGTDNRDNLLNNKAWQWRVKFIDVWNRETEHGIISDLWYSSLSACMQESSSQARCLKLTFDSGCAAIVKIQIEFRIWQANDPLLSVPSDWFLHDTIDKYDQSNPLLQWYRRAKNPLLNYNPATNHIDYVFCADKGTTALPIEQTSRNENPITRAASSVFNINKSIGTANHLRGFAPLNSGVLKNVKFTVEKPTVSEVCVSKPRTVYVYAHIRTVHDEINWLQKIRAFEGHNVFGSDDSKGNRLDEFHQRLPDKQEGFIGYFAGTNDWVISTQCRLNILTGEVIEVGLGDFWTGLTLPDNIRDFIEFEKQYPPVQRWVFKNVMPGKRIFRVAAVRATATEYKTTSIPISGTSKFYAPDQWSEEGIAEMHIDQCEGDVDYRDEMLIICDLTRWARSVGVNQINNVIQGYIYEDQINKIPIERAWVTGPAHAVRRKWTDHNGYYWAVSDKRNWNLEIWGTRNCQQQQRIGITETTRDSNGARYRDEKLYVYIATNPYPVGDRIYIRGRVVLCSDPGVGVAGVLVMLTNGATAITDDTGNYTIIAHDSGDTQTRREDLKFTQQGLCLIGRCDQPCSTCFDDMVYTTPLCTGAQRLYPMPTLQVSVQRNISRGPQTGGRYELALIPHYEISMLGFGQRLPEHVVDIPTIGEQGVFGFSKIKYYIDPATVFPQNLNLLTIAITKNLNYDNFLTWIAEKVDLVDNTGNVNTVTPTHLKLYYSGLLEYNLQNGLATNSVWQAIDQREAPVVGDRIEFIVNGDAVFFPKRISSLVKFDQEGFYMLINYSDELRDLKEGAQFKIIRPRANAGANLFYEQCKVIKVTNGRIAPEDSTGYLNYFDSYLINRQIPVPYYAIDPATKLLKKDPAKSLLKTFSFPFEHHSPSDFWGDHAANRGRVFTVNPFENQQCRTTEVAVSKALDYDGVLNGLHYFTNGDITEFDKQEWGAITTVIAHIGTLTLICQLDNFEIAFDDNTVRMTQDGRLEAIPLSSRLGRPGRKKGNRFGCHAEDINTVREYNGLILFLDRSESALVALYNGQAEDVSINGFKGHLKDKIKYMVSYNGMRTGYWKFFHGTFDPRRKQYLLTMFTIPAGVESSYTPDSEYINQLRDKSIIANETLAYSPFEKSFKLTYSYTPEYFGTLFGHEADNQLLSFKNGVAWFHHKKATAQNKTYMNFYGVQCEPVYEAIHNNAQNTVKRYLWTEVMCRETLFFIDRIITESGQRSRLLSIWWDKRENFYTADFKMNMLTYADPNIPALKDPSRTILEGEPLSGKWLKARYVGSPDMAGKYFEFDGVHIFTFTGQKSGTTQPAQDLDQ